MHHKPGAVKVGQAAGIHALLSPLLMAVLLLSAQELHTQTLLPLLLADTFDSDWTVAPAHYALFQDSGFRAVDGALLGDLSFRGSSWLFLLPASGERGSLAFSASHSGTDAASFTVALSTQHNLIWNPLYLQVNLGAGQVRFAGGAEARVSRMAYQFTPEQSYRFLLQRNGAEVQLAINDQPLLNAVVNPRQAEQELELPYRHAYTWAFYMDSKGNDPNPNRNRSRLEAFTPNRVRFDNLELRGSYDGPAYRKTEQSFLLAGKTHHFSLIHEAGWEAWAKGACQYAAQTMQRMFEQSFPVEADVPNLGAVVSRGVYYPGGGNNNRLGITYQWANQSDNPPRLSNHELAHNWGALYSDFSAKEGTTYIEPVINSEHFQGLFRTSAHLEPRWNITAWPADKQQRFKSALLGQRGEFDYEKGAVFWYILYRELGYTIWLEAHRQIAAAGRWLDYAAIRKILERLSGRDLGPLFLGWVESGQGRYDPLDVFKDSDGDGLPDLDERLLGTNPMSTDSDADGYADLLEVTMGYSPIDARDNPTGSIIPGGPALQWQRPGVVILNDAKSDNSPYDLKSLSYYMDIVNRQLLFRVEWHTPVFGSPAFREQPAFTQFYFGNQRKAMDWRIVAWTNADPAKDSVSAFVYDPAARGIGRAGISSARNGEALELLVPLDFFSTATELWFALDGGGGGGPKDQLDNNRDWHIMIPAPAGPLKPKRPWLPVW